VPTKHRRVESRRQSLGAESPRSERRPPAESRLPGAAPAPLTPAPVADEASGKDSLQGRNPLRRSVPVLGVAC